MFDRTQNDLFNNEVDTIYIYIPFKKDEISATVSQQFDKFYQNHKPPYKWDNYVLLHHGECGLDNLPNGTKMYVLAHGIDISPDRTKSSLLMDPKLPYDSLKHLPYTDWAYSVSGGIKAITIDEIAQRMIADGLLESDQLNIKLWFCDPNCKAHAIAERFVSNFLECENNFKVDYYVNKSLYRPLYRGEMHKWAADKMKAADTAVRASSIRKSLFTNPRLEEIVVESPDNSKKNEKVFSKIPV